MKNLLIIILIFMLFSSDECAHTTYCDGWEDGYKQGWCYEDNACIEPVVPVCPIPKVGQNTYQDGYNRAFIKGRAARKNN